MRRRFMSQSDYLQPMYFEAVEDGLTIRLPSYDIEYRIGIDGEWQTLSAGESTPSINSGTKIFFKKESKGSLGRFVTNVGFRLGGDCRSLLYGEKVTKDSPLYINCFSGLFSNSLLVEVEDNILPTTNLAPGCYFEMFQGCTSLINAPELPATTLANNCYHNMFNGCSNLNYIKMLATDISATSCLYNWVSGVSPTGTFIKHPNMTSLSTGTSGIPSGWTVVNDGEESGGSKIVNNLSYSIGRLDKITFTFQYPVESDVDIYFFNSSTVETTKPVTIEKGNNTVTTLTDALIENDAITITRIVPNEDSTYIYTW